MEKVNYNKIDAIKELPTMGSIINSEKYNVRFDEIMVGCKIFAIYNSRHYNETEKPSVIITSFNDSYDVICEKYGFSDEDSQVIFGLGVGEVAISDDYGYDACVIRLS